MKMMMNRMVLLLLLPLMASCGQELTAGGYTGEVETVVVDEPNGGPAGSSSRETSALRSSISPQLQSQPRGEVQVRASAVLIGEDGSVVPLTVGARTASLSLAAGDSAQLDLNGEVAAARYNKVRVTFSGVTADVTAPVVAGPLSLVGRITVALTEPVTVEAPILLDVQPEGSYRVIVDLNSAVWLARADPATRTVSGAAFAAAVEVRVR